MFQIHKNHPAHRKVEMYFLSSLLIFPRPQGVLSELKCCLIAAACFLFPQSFHYACNSLVCEGDVTSLRSLLEFTVGEAGLVWPHRSLCVQVISANQASSLRHNEHQTSP